MSDRRLQGGTFAVTPIGHIDRTADAPRKRTSYVNNTPKNGCILLSPNHENVHIFTAGSMTVHKPLWCLDTRFVINWKLQSLIANP